MYTATVDQVEFGRSYATEDQVAFNICISMVCEASSGHKAVK